MKNTELSRKLTDLFTQTQHCAQQLHTCLLRELDHLKASDAEKLMSNSLVKDGLMNDLLSHEAARKALLHENKIESKEAYLNWLSELDDSQSLKKRWLEVSELISQCQQLNNTNGIVSDKMAESSEQVLNILSGNAYAKPTTYTAEGKKPDSKTSLHNTTA